MLIGSIGISAGPVTGGGPRTRLVIDERVATSALIGPGRAGTTIALALRRPRLARRRGRRPRARRRVDARSGRVPRLARRRSSSEAGRGAAARDHRDARPRDRAAALAAAASLEPGALVVHLAGSRGLDVFDAVAREAARRARRRAAPAPVVPVDDGRARAPARLVGGRRRRCRRSPCSPRRSGCRPFTLADADAPRYHAAAVVASNHLVALLGQVERLAASCGVPFEAFAPARPGVGRERVPARARRTRSPVRSNAATSRTVESHLARARPRRTGRVPRARREAARLTGRRDSALDRLLGDLRQTGRRRRSGVDFAALASESSDDRPTCASAC